MGSALIKARGRSPTTPTLCFPSPGVSHLHHCYCWARPSLPPHCHSVAPPPLGPSQQAGVCVWGEVSASASAPEPQETGLRTLRCLRYVSWNVTRLHPRAVTLPRNCVRCWGPGFVLHTPCSPLSCSRTWLFSHTTSLNELCFFLEGIFFFSLQFLEK